MYCTSWRHRTVASVLSFSRLRILPDEDPRCFHDRPDCSQLIVGVVLAMYMFSMCVTFDVIWLQSVWFRSRECHDVSTKGR